MLVLTRKKGERVMIGDDIVVTIIDVRGDGVRIGFDAPRGIAIQRAEVLTAVTEANTTAAATSAANADTLVGLLTKAKAKPAEAAEAAASTPDAAPDAAVDATPDGPVAPAAPVTRSGQIRRPKPGPRTP